jgi:hypothetical protein
MSITRPVPTSDDLIGPDSEGIYKRLGRIEQADLGWEGHGIFTVFLSFDFGGLHQGLPGGCLDAPVKDETGKFTGREGTAFGHDYIIGVMQAVGVERWSQLKGKLAYALYEDRHWNSPIVGIEAEPTRSDPRRVIFKDIAAKHGLPRLKDV